MYKRRTENVQILLLKLCNLLALVIGFPNSCKLFNSMTGSRSKYRFSLVKVNYGLHGSMHEDWGSVNHFFVFFTHKCLKIISHLYNCLHFHLLAAIFKHIHTRKLWVCDTCVPLERYNELRKGADRTKLRWGRGTHIFPFFFKEYLHCIYS